MAYDVEASEVDSESRLGQTFPHLDDRGSDRRNGVASTADLGDALAQLADLPLSEERLSALEDGLATMIGEHAELRALPLDLTPHLVFDPRWD